MSISVEARGAQLGEVLAVLKDTGVVPGAGAALDAAISGVAAKLREAVLAEIPAYGASGNPDVLPGLARHAGEHIAEIRRLFAGEAVGDFAFVREHVRLRAEQRFPLEAILHAYRSGHRILSRWLWEAAVAVGPKDLERALAAVADFAIAYTDTISIVAAADYVEAARTLAEAESELRTELLSTLLNGYDESDARVAALLKNAGYLEQRLSYTVVLARSANAAEMESPARAQRLAAALSDAVASTAIRKLIGLRDNLAVAVFSERRRLSGWTAPQASLAGRLQSLLLVLGPAVLVGVSADHPSTAFIPKAIREARIALDFASLTERVVGFSALPIRSLVVHHGAPNVQSAPPAWVPTLVEANAKAEGALVETLRALAGADMNVQQAARSLGRHANTVYARLERVRDITGLDGQRYNDLTELLLAADCWRL
ncbi:MAG: helix-turn-helix domain-containing protein [Bauldia sp.]